VFQKDRFGLLTACTLLRKCFAAMLALPRLLTGVKKSMLLHRLWSRKLLTTHITYRAFDCKKLAELGAIDYGLLTVCMGSHVPLELTPL
jgi:hypothetical protein